MYSELIRKIEEYEDFEKDVSILKRCKLLDEKLELMIKIKKDMNSIEFRKFDLNNKEDIKQFIKDNNMNPEHLYGKGCILNKHNNVIFPKEWKCRLVPESSNGIIIIDEATSDLENREYTNKNRKSLGLKPLYYYKDV